MIVENLEELPEVIARLYQTNADLGLVMVHPCDLDGEIIALDADARKVAGWLVTMFNRVDATL
jgi:hypothetical protein